MMTKKLILLVFALAYVGLVEVWFHGATFYFPPNEALPRWRFMVHPISVGCFMIGNFSAQDEQDEQALSGGAEQCFRAIACRLKSLIHPV